MIEINNLTTNKVDKKFLEGLAEKVLKGENRKEMDLSVVFVSKDKIRELNKKYRKQDKLTDVLSFGEGLNEIVICPAKVKAKKNLARVLIHGILHILGHEHSEKMQEKENYYLKGANLKELSFKQVSLAPLKGA